MILVEYAKQMADLYWLLEILTRDVTEPKLQDKPMDHEGIYTHSYCKALVSIDRRAYNLYIKKNTSIFRNGGP